jgi:hypothetical protein
LANHFNKQEKEWRRFKPMQGTKGLANGLDLLGKMIMAIQCMGYKIGNLRFYLEVVWQMLMLLLH